MRLRRSIVLVSAAIGLLGLAVVCFPNPPVLQFMHHDQQYFRDFARACDSLLERHPLGTNTTSVFLGTIRRCLGLSRTCATALIECPSRVTGFTLLCPHRITASGSLGSRRTRPTQTSGPWSQPVRAMRG